MALVVTLATAIGLLALLQAIHIVRSGDIRMFVIRTWRSRLDREFASVARATRARRALAAVAYGVPACGILALLVSKGIANRPALAAWLNGDLLGGLAFFSAGFSTLLWPHWMLGGIRSTYPDADTRLEGRFGTTLIACFAVGALVVGMLLLRGAEPAG